MNNGLKGTIVNPDTIYGKSAYEIAVLHGFDGTEEEWLASLKGEGADIEDLKINEADLINMLNEEMPLTLNISEELDRIMENQEALIGGDVE